MLREIITLVDGPISAEVVATDAEGMIREAEELAQIDPDKIVVKLPLIEDGLKATRVLSEKGLKTNVTLVFSPLQALLAAKAGATYVSPFVGRLDDIGHDGMEIVDQIRTIFDNYGYATEIIVASVRSPQHVLQAGLI
ncbi:MAG: transaldolase family protein, partial [Desulfuromonadales bacterium]